MRSTLRFSILELLALILVPGLAIAAVRAGGVSVSLALLAGMLCYIAFAVAAFFGSGSNRAFAGGFVVAAGIYGGLLFYFGESETDLAGRLPTSQLLRPLIEATSTYTYIDARTGAVLSDAEVEAERALGPRSALSVKGWPDRKDYMLVGQLLIGLSLGYLGGKLAVSLERRADGRRSAPPS